jgi:hypothetical protein
MPFIIRVDPDPLMVEVGVQVPPVPHLVSYFPGLAAELLHDPLLSQGGEEDKNLVAEVVAAEDGESYA